MKKVTSLAILLLLPIITQAQTLGAFFTNFTVFLNNTVIPFLLGIAFLFFVFNTFRFFIVGASNEQGRDKAKALAIYGVSAFVLIIVFWGIINMFSGFLGLEGETQPKNDYVEKMGG